MASQQQHWTVVHDLSTVYVFGGFVGGRRRRCLVFKRAPLDEPGPADADTPALVHRCGLLAQEHDNISERRVLELNMLGFESKKTGPTSAITCCALAGVFVVWRYPCLVVVQDMKPVGIWFGECIYKVKRFQLIPLFDQGSMPRKDAKRYKQYKKYFKQHTQRMNMYFSYLGNIVQSVRHIFLQKKMKNSKNNKNMIKQPIEGIQDEEKEEEISNNSNTQITLDDFLLDKMSVNDYMELVEHKYTYNSAILRNIVGEVRDKTSFVLLTCGAILQTYLSTSRGPTLFPIIMRKARHYVGPRFRKRGISHGGDVGNDVETEVVLARPYPMLPEGFYTAYLVYRGSVPARWSQHAALTQATPPFIIAPDRLQDNFSQSVAHLRGLVREYGNVIVLSLLKAGPKNKESALSGLLEKCVKHYNAQCRVKDLGRDRCGEEEEEEEEKKKKKNCKSKDNEQSLEHDQEIYGKYHISDVVHLDVSNIKSHVPRRDYDIALRTALSHVAALNGFTSFRLEAHKPISVHTLQHSVTRVNCVDCLDRTNDAQMILTLANTSRMLQQNGDVPTSQQRFEIPAGPLQYIRGPRWAIRPTLNGVLPQALRDDIAYVFKKCGDRISLEYCGSDAHDKSANAKKGKAAILNLKRHIDSNFTARDEQLAADIFHGLFEINFLTSIDVWDIDDENEKLLHMHGAEEVYQRLMRLREEREEREEQSTHAAPSDTPPSQPSPSSPSSPLSPISPTITTPPTPTDATTPTETQNVVGNNKGRYPSKYITTENIYRDYAELHRPGGPYTKMFLKIKRSSSKSSGAAEFEALHDFSSKKLLKQSASSSQINTEAHNSVNDDASSSASSGPYSSSSEQDIEKETLESSRIPTVLIDMSTFCTEDSQVSSPSSAYIQNQQQQLDIPTRSHISNSFISSDFAQSNNNKTNNVIRPFSANELGQLLGININPSPLSQVNSIEQQLQQQQQQQTTSQSNNNVSNVNIPIDFINF